MDRIGDEQPKEHAHTDGPTLVLLELSANEKVIWSGRPCSTRRLVLQSAPKAFTGLGFIAFTLLWMVMVIRGGRNNWDRGQVVPPFARHNVLIAAFAGLWLIPPALILLTWPFRTWQSLRHSFYALTDRRAIIIESGYLGRTKTREYSAHSLGLMRVEAHSDGTGDLIFESPSSWVGPAQTVGFLAIDQAEAVENLVRETLFAAGTQPTNSPGRSTQQSAAPTAVSKCYRLSLAMRLFQFVFLGAGILVAFCLLGNLVVFLAILIIQPQFIVDGLIPELGQFGAFGIASAIAGGLGSLLTCLLVCWLFFRFALGFPIEITVDEDRSINFRSRLRTVTIPVDNVVSIRTGDWFDPNRFQALVRHKSGKLLLVNHFSDFKDFLTTVKTLNPAIEIKGF
jgi:hypothetical protein